MLAKFEDIWRNCKYELSIFRFSTTKGWIWVTFFVWNKFWRYFVEAGLFYIIFSILSGVQRWTLNPHRTCQSTSSLTTPCCLSLPSRSPCVLTCESKKFRFTLLETKISPYKWMNWNSMFLLGRPIFRGELLVSGREQSVVKTTLWRNFPNRAWQVGGGLIHTVDGSEIPNNPPGMYETL